MSGLLDLSFAALGGVAVAAILVSLHRYAPRIAEMRRALQAPPEAEELRTTLREYRVTPERAKPGPLRHNHRPKPIKHRLRGHNSRRARA